MTGEDFEGDGDANRGSASAITTQDYMLVDIVYETVTTKGGYGGGKH